jgi:hypothetical protein
MLNFIEYYINYNKLLLLHKVVFNLILILYTKSFNYNIIYLSILLHISCWLIIETCVEL